VDTKSPPVYEPSLRAIKMMDAASAEAATTKSPARQRTLGLSPTTKLDRTFSRPKERRSTLGGDNVGGGGDGRVFFGFCFFGFS
jgi:hypothetical protein